MSERRELCESPVSVLDWGICLGGVSVFGTASVLLFWVLSYQYGVTVGVLSTLDMRTVEFQLVLMVASGFLAVITVLAGFCVVCVVLSVSYLYDRYDKERSVFPRGSQGVVK